MDPVAASASLANIITFALQSAKVIYETIAGIRDGPIEVRRLGSATEVLRQLLMQLNQLTTQGSQHGYDVADASLQPLKNQVERCSTDLQGITAKISRLQVEVEDELIVKSWKRIKTFLREKDFGKMWRIVQHNVEVLGLQLSIVSRFVKVSREEIVS